jgi:hypothetical protein
MKRILLLLVGISSLCTTLAQTRLVPAEYISMVHKAQQLYESKQFKQAAMQYEQASGLLDCRLFTQDLYNQACSWALAGDIGQAIRCLERLVFDLNFQRLKLLESDPDLNAIRTHELWEPIIIQAQKNASELNRSNLENEVVFRPLTDYAKLFLGDRAKPLLSINHGNYRLYFSGNSYTAKHLDKVRSELDIAHHRICEVLDSSHANIGVNLYAVDSEEDMQTLRGSHAKGIGMVGHDLVFFVFNDSVRPQLKHELFHVIAPFYWGKTGSKLLNEGGAVYTDNTCYYNNPIYTICSYFRQTNKLFEWNRLTDSFRACQNENDFIAYLQAAGLFKFLYENYGVEKMKKLWFAGFESFEEIYGFSMDVLWETWDGLIGTQQVPKDFNWEMLQNYGCG